jgi:hypothetical protein
MLPGAHPLERLTHLRKNIALGNAAGIALVYCRA